jgi:hypothetical protein
LKGGKIGGDDEGASDEANDDKKDGFELGGNGAFGVFEVGVGIGFEGLEGLLKLAGFGGLSENVFDIKREAGGRGDFEGEPLFGPFGKLGEGFAQLRGDYGKGSAAERICEGQAKGRHSGDESSDEAEVRELSQLGDAREELGQVPDNPAQRREKEGTQNGDGEKSGDGDQGWSEDTPLGRAKDDSSERRKTVDPVIPEHGNHTRYDGGTEEGVKSEEDAEHSEGVGGYGFEETASAEGSAGGLDAEIDQFGEVIGELATADESLGGVWEGAVALGEGLGQRLSLIEGSSNGLESLGAVGEVLLGTGQLDKPWGERQPCFGEGGNLDEGLF